MVAGVCTRASFRGIVAEQGWIMVEIIRREDAKNVRKERMEVVCMMILIC